jgi:AhpC/TSA family
LPARRASRQEVADASSDNRQPGICATPSEHLNACTVDFARRRRSAPACPRLRLRGNFVPDFRLNSQVGPPVNLHDFRGKRTILDFYPNEPNARLYD